MGVADLLDTAIEAPVVTSFTRLGYAFRCRLDDWKPLDDYDLHGRVMVLTGATSGLGLAAAEQLARCGAELVLLGRNPDKTETVRDQIRRVSGNDAIGIVIADMGDFAAVRAAAEQIRAEHPRVDALLHNAGALADTRSEAPDGSEATVASQVIGPFLLTALLLDRLSDQHRPGRVITMSSGGMYATGLRIDRLEMPAENYNGSEQYARAKRAQVTLNEMWAAHPTGSGVRFHALHPGWADTPGVAESLPTFRRVVGPLLRTPAQGADTMVWLAAAHEPGRENGRFWLDRRVRPIHKLGRTRKTDTPARRAALWQFCIDRAGLGDDFAAAN